jgi:hypothetical protein
MMKSIFGQEARLGALVATVAAFALAVSATPALATTFVHNASQKVALIPQAGPVPSAGPGMMPTSSYVTGRPSESFNRFQFSNLPVNQITPANLSKFDTVALIQVRSVSLSTRARAALARFVAGGGKLLIHDSDETSRNDYTWLLPGGLTTQIGLGCIGCGSASGTATVLANSSLISANPADPSYVNFPDLAKFTDALGDSNLFVSTNPRWIPLSKGTNARNESGANLAYASNNNGLIVYNGFDTDFIKTSASDPFLCNNPNTGYKCPKPPAAQPTVDYLAQMWYSELAQGWGTPPNSGGGSGGGGTGGGGGNGLPHPKPVVDIGTLIAASSAGLPSNRLCVANRTLLLALKRLAHVPHRRIVQADVYVNRKHVLRERRHFTNKRIKHLPRHGKYTVRVIATTARGFHLIAQRRYRAC